jgi:uncharacterized protein (TIGR00369 family)
MAQPPASIFDHLTAPACAVHLGWQLLEIDPAKGSIKVQFAPKPEFLNPAGYVQGGFIVAMMDDTMGPAVLAHTEGRKLTSSIDIHAHFLRPVRLGPVVVDAHVIGPAGRVHRGQALRPPGQVVRTCNVERQPLGV